MGIGRLDHVNVRTARLTEMCAWYERVLGMKAGPRPGFSFPGAWLYAGEYPVVHLVGVERTPGADAGDLRIEHFALSATGLDDFLAHLRSEGVPCRLSRPPGFGIAQVNIHDPDGNHIHVDFTGPEAATATA